MRHRATIVVLAKAPEPGRVKTRLCPPCTPEQAATLAEAALVDTLEAVAATRGVRGVLALDGDPGAWSGFGIPVVAQAVGGLDERIAAVFSVAVGPTLVVGMDTPQVTPKRFEAAACALASQDVDAVLGRADDGGYWVLGLAAPDPAAVLGIPMSCAHTGAAQARRLEELGLRTQQLASARDVDTFDDAIEVARRAPETRFAATLDAMDVAGVAMTSAP
jgi:glycosyltransferase A (GT-A) superfamily protein (DUF2064 family)